MQRRKLRLRGLSYLLCLPSKGSSKWVAHARIIRLWRSPKYNYKLISSFPCHFYYKYLIIGANSFIGKYFIFIFSLFSLICSHVKNLYFKYNTFIGFISIMQYIRELHVFTRTFLKLNFIKKLAYFFFLKIDKVWG